MSMIDLDQLAGRAGRLDCVCPPEEAGKRASEGLWRLAVGFGLAVLAQTLVLAALPVSAAAIAPQPWLAGAPYALTLLGATGATFPAAFLVDSFGRRGALALGASLGVAGGALAAFAALNHAFALLCVGAFWLGLSNGFALFYRHAAAAGPSGARGGAFVFAGGALAAFAAPALLQMAGDKAGPFADAWALAAAGGVDLLALLVAIFLPHALARPRADAPAQGDVARFYVATALGALAWFAMTAMMARAASSLIGCGASAATVGGVIAWHLMAMYAPSALLRASPWTPPAGATLGAGFALIVGGLALFVGATDTTRIAAAMVAAGAGWSLANAGLLQMLYARGTPSRTMLAGHDFALFSSALAGAMAAPLF